jgi:hypothetical protein
MSLSTVTSTQDINDTEAKNQPNTGETNYCLTSAVKFIDDAAISSEEMSTFLVSFSSVRLATRKYP